MDVIAHQADWDSMSTLGNTRMPLPGFYAEGTTDEPTS
jgi:hypothetical protein